jgi:hypothetical protein
MIVLAACSGVGGSVSSTTSGSRSSDSSIAEANEPYVPLLPKPGTAYLGAYVNPGITLGPFETVTGQFEQQIGRPLAIHAEYYKWYDSFPGAPEIDDYEHGRVPVISWDCGATANDVATGVEDGILIEHARAFKAYGHRIFLRYFWEMNLPYAVEERPHCVDPVRDINGYVSPSDYIAAWDHMRAVFAAQGVTNVVWVWCPSGSLTINPLNYYPGPSETDWIGFDHYDLTGTLGLDETLASPYSALAGLNQPMMIAETGTVGSTQSSFLSVAPSVLQGDFPLIRGLMYYDGYGHRQDWRLTADGLSTFASIAATPYLSAQAHLGGKGY